MKKQRGVSFIGFLVVLAAVGFAAFVGMKLFPMYQEFYAVKAAAKGLAEQPGVADMDPAKIRDLLARRFDIGYVSTVKGENIKIERIEGGWNLSINYEVRKPLVYNLDVVGKFDVSQDLTRRGGGE